eukprot:CAMPEP_0182844310 /NCGR_PEP_ID=MMETSP0006_2-20121128/26691_1 /TAXON_ID=97485 /ORGANISM="Prymnesium parvum, Strain Texoma1" /LENGTH=74 /DNA_ID=CAMNT_0024974237 /DNA_START=538 /DNA_END=762 /DNA_ORIENTATION=+
MVGAQLVSCYGWSIAESATGLLELSSLSEQVNHIADRNQGIGMTRPKDVQSGVEILTEEHRRLFKLALLAEKAA